MASSFQSLKRVLRISSSSSSALKYASTRGFCQPSSRCPFKQLDSYLQDLKKSVCPSFVTLERSIGPADDLEIHHSRGRGAGVFLEPNFIVTSANVVGHVTTFYESKTVEKPDRFEHGCIRHKSYISNMVAYTFGGKMLKTKPVAVNFANNLAVLKVVKPEGDFSSHRELSSYVPRKDDVFMAITHPHILDSVIVLGNVRAIGESTVGAKAPWPLDNELGWMEHDWFTLGGGEKKSGSITKISGSPWFNLYGEVAGIESWVVEVESAHISLGFAVSSLCIKAVLDYAKTKGPEDPIVMDRWIDAHVAPGMDS